MVGGDFDIPIMYQDLANYTMGPMMMPLGSITAGNTSYLGGTQMKPQLDHDKIEIMNKKEAEGKSTAKKVALGLGAVFLMGFVSCLFGKKGLKTSLSNLWTKIKGQPNKWGRFKAWCGQKWTSFKNLFRKNSGTPAPTP